MSTLPTPLCLSPLPRSPRTCGLPASCAVHRGVRAMASPAWRAAAPATCRTCVQSRPSVRSPPGGGQSPLMALAQHWPCRPLPGPAWPWSRTSRPGGAHLALGALVKAVHAGGQCALGSHQAGRLPPQILPRGRVASYEDPGFCPCPLPQGTQTSTVHALHHPALFFGTPWRVSGTGPGVGRCQARAVTLGHLKPLQCT